MAVFTQEAVQANVRVRDGKRVFFLAEGDHLTPSARDWLRQDGVEVRPAESASIPIYTTPDGCTLTEKPEHMTHLRPEVLVPKHHPRIVFRGILDALEAELLLCIAAAAEKTLLAKDLDELLQLARRIMRCDVLEEPLPEFTLCGLTPKELRTHSHMPQKYYDQPHFMPSSQDSHLLLQLNRLRTLVRQTELACCEAFRDRDGALTRGDLLRALNRMSSLVWILMIRLKREERNLGTRA